MKYKIMNSKTKTKQELRRAVLKWVIYFLFLLFFYMIMRSGTFNFWQPFLIIPLAVSVSLHERELPSCIFALFCGYFIDIACDFIFGFSAVWLMVVSVAASLLSRNLIRVNAINFCWINAVAVLLEFFMHYLFNIVIWDIKNGSIIYDRSISPTIISTLILSPIIYLIIKTIYKKLSQSHTVFDYSADISSEDDISITKS